MLLVATIYIVVVLLLCAGFYRAHPLEILKRAGRAAAKAMAAMRDDTLDELQKEKTVQACAVDMTRQAVALTVKLIVIFVVAGFPVWLAASIGWIDAGVFWAFALRVDVLLITTAAILGPLLAYRHFFGKPGQ